MSLATFQPAQLNNMSDNSATLSRLDSDAMELFQATCRTAVQMIFQVAKMPL